MKAVVCQIEEAEETVSGDLRILIRSESFPGKGRSLWNRRRSWTVDPSRHPSDADSESRKSGRV